MVSEQRILASTGWSPFSSRERTEILYKEKGDKRSYIFDGKHRSFLLSQALERITIEEFPTSWDTAKKRVIVPLFYQGLGDWLRTVKAIQEIYHKDQQHISLICLDLPLAREFIASQLQAYVSSVVWLPKDYPFYDHEPVSSLDWKLSVSQINWELLTPHIIRLLKDKDPILLRNPNHKLPPYGETQGYDVRLGLHATNHPWISFATDTHQQQAAEQWWQENTSLPQCSVGIGFRNDQDLLSAHRNTDIELINRFIFKLANICPHAILIFFGNRPPDGIQSGSMPYVDFTEAWVRGYSIPAQAAILAKTQAVVGINSGGIDLPLASGIPGYRIRAHAPPSPFLNNHLASPFVVNLDKQSLNDESVANVSMDFFLSQVFIQGMKNRERTIHYFSSQGQQVAHLTNRHLQAVDIEHVLRGNPPSVVLFDTQQQTIREAMLFQAYKQGKIPIVLSPNNHPDIEHILHHGYGVKYLEGFCAGYCIRPTELEPTLRDLQANPAKAVLLSTAGYQKFLAQQETSLFRSL